MRTSNVGITGDMVPIFFRRHGVDFIYASRPAERGWLSNATAIQTAFGELRVVSTEGLIGLKLQGSSTIRAARKMVV